MAFFRRRVDAGHLLTLEPVGSSVHSTYGIIFSISLVPPFAFFFLFRSGSPFSIGRGCFSPGFPGQSCPSFPNRLMGGTVGSLWRLRLACLCFCLRVANVIFCRRYEVRFPPMTGETACTPASTGETAPPCPPCCPAGLSLPMPLPFPAAGLPSFLGSPTTLPL